MAARYDSFQSFCSAEQCFFFFRSFLPIIFPLIRIVQCYCTLLSYRRSTYQRAKVNGRYSARTLAETAERDGINLIN